jgi:hypothetical protein
VPTLLDQPPRIGQLRILPSQPAYAPGYHPQRIRGDLVRLILPPPLPPSGREGGGAMFAAVLGAAVVLAAAACLAVLGVARAVGEMVR